MNSLRLREMKCCSTRALSPVGILDIRASCRAEVLSTGTWLIQRCSVLLLQLHAVVENPGNTVIFTVLGPSTVTLTVSWSTLIYKTFDLHLLEGVPFTFLALYYLPTKLLILVFFSLHVLWLAQLENCLHSITNESRGKEWEHFENGSSAETKTLPRFCFETDWALQL